MNQALPPFLQLRPGIEGKAADRGREGARWAPQNTPFIPGKAESMATGAGRINQYRLTFLPAAPGHGVGQVPSEELLGSDDP